MTNNGRVLVVEDDQIIVKSLEQILSGHGYQVTAATDTESAWSALTSGDSFATVLLDRGLPDRDGITLLARMKENPILRHVPVIILTSRADVASVREGLGAGAYYYLTKPQVPAITLAVVTAAIEQRQDILKLQAAMREAERTLHYLCEGTFRCRTLAEACELALGLAKVCPDPKRAVLGLHELLINAVEHGNLGITYAEKMQLIVEGLWLDEVTRRSEDCPRTVTVNIERTLDTVRLTIQDEGAGFAWQDYLDFAPERAFDPHGRGIAMTKVASFDSMEYRGNGNIVVVTMAGAPPQQCCVPTRSGAGSRI